MTKANIFSLTLVICMGKEHLMASHDGFSGLGIIVEINSIALFVMSLLLLFLGIQR